MRLSSLPDELRVHPLQEWDAEHGRPSRQGVLVYLGVSVAAWMVTVILLLVVVG